MLHGKNYLSYYDPSILFTKLFMFSQVVKQLACRTEFKDEVEIFLRSECFHKINNKGMFQIY